MLMVPSRSSPPPPPEPPSAPPPPPAPTTRVVIEVTEFGITNVHSVVFVNFSRTVVADSADTLV